MANETSTSANQSVNQLVEAIGKVGQMQMEIVSSALQSVASAAEPFGKASSELAGNVMQAVQETLQNISSAVAPKQ